MTGRVRLFYKDTSDIVGGDGFSIVRLVDADEQRVICVICDRDMTAQLSIRHHRVPERERMLPEVLVSMLLDEGANDLELKVYDILDGQYCVTLLNRRTLSLKSIRMSDAVLLHYISKIPFYMDEALMVRQSIPYQPEVSGLSIPINTLDTEWLNKELKRAIEIEDYRLAANLNEELKKRTQS